MIPANRLGTRGYSSHTQSERIISFYELILITGYRYY